MSWSFYRLSNKKSFCSSSSVEASTAHSITVFCEPEPGISQSRFCLYWNPLHLYLCSSVLTKLGLFWSRSIHENSCPAFIICHFCLDSTRSLPTLVLCNCTFDGNVLASAQLSARTGPPRLLASCCCHTEKLQLLVRAVVVLLSIWYDFCYPIIPIPFWCCYNCNCTF